MIQEIIDGIIAAIRTEYDKSFRIYTESLEQGLIEPCFSILCLSQTREKQTTNRYMNTIPFNITYFPSTDEPISECNSVCEILYDILELISADGHYLRGSRMNGQVVDGVLQFQVNYSPFVIHREEQEGMNDLEVKTDSKG